MNFEEWYKSLFTEDDEYDQTFEDAKTIKLASKDAWDSCKNEVLKILKKNAYSHEDEDTIREIKKL